jgi:putative transposase
MDITYIPMRRGFVYLAAVLDWATRRVLAWRLSNTMTADFCLDALDSAIRDFGLPEILNTDQGSQFTGTAFVGVVQQHGIQLSMDGKGAWCDNLFVERLWKSVKYEEVYLHAYDSVTEARESLARYFTFYNRGRPHASLGPGLPESPPGLPAPLITGHRLPRDARIMARSILGGLQHEYEWERLAA